MNKILIASNNKWKIKEILDALDWLSFEFVSLDDLNIRDDVEENWKSYEENAKLKAEFFWKISGLPTIADDSWIVVEALKWELWVKTRRWGAWEKASDKQWLDHFMNRMKDESNNKAQFFTSIAFSYWNQIHIFNWNCEGILLKTLSEEIEQWIPLSAIFIPNWFNAPYCVLSTKDKNKISHRWKAATKLKKHLENIKSKN